MRKHPIVWANPKFLYLKYVLSITDIYILLPEFRYVEPARIEKRLTLSGWPTLQREK